MNKPTTSKKLASSLENLKKANDVNKSKKFGIWRCKTCNKEARATVHQLRKTYCSSACMALDYKTRLSGENNPRYKNAAEKTCLSCGKIYKSYQKDRKFCSHECYNKENFHLRTYAKKDANHNMLVEILQSGGASVKDMSKMAGGFPDILVWYLEEWHLIEIKNPKTHYGKQGLNKLQKQFAEGWNGGAVFVFKTEDDAKNFLAGKFEEIEQVGNYRKLNTMLQT
jgi:endogenous inhibitor of DNA gyrase (YacG/DUF329 family)